MNKPDDASSTNSSDSPVDETAAPDEQQSESLVNEQAEDQPQLSDTVTDPAESSSQQEDDLPEYEPLTPELVEEEAIRGDFMLQWSAVLVGVLLAWTVIDRTEVLVHVKTGQYLLSNGLLPPSVDVFSATAEGQPWVNLNWMWDALVGFVYNVLGSTGLSLLSAGIAFVIFLLISRLSLPGVSTWWGSICAVLAALACFPSLTATSHIVTLLGLTVTLWLLYRWQWNSEHSLWPIVGVMFLWANLDDRAWIGAVLMMAFTLGAWMDGFRTLPGDARKLQVSTLGVVTLTSLLAMLVHPFLWETWASPYWLYSVEYPVLREYISSDMSFAFERFPAIAPRFWKDVGFFNASALLLMAISSVTLLLNRERLRLSTAFSLLAINLIGIAGGRELAVASLINAVVSTVNAQEWYRANFRQTYSLDANEILWSRGGRALTVLSIFALAFATVSGHLMGADGRRVGMGFSPELTHQIESYKSLTADAFDDRAFVFRLEQGDLLIWCDWKPFVDSRVRLYGDGTKSLSNLHLETRMRMRNRDPQYAELDRKAWTEVFEQYNINQVMPRLSGIGPDYITYYDLMMSPSWQLTGQGAATAIFTRADTTSQDLRSYLKNHDDSSFVDTFMRTEVEGVEEVLPRGVWPQAPSFYNSKLFLPDNTLSNETRLAQHYNVLRSVVLSRQEIGVAVALAYGAIREARKGLRENPNSITGYRILADAFQFLAEIETAIQASQNQLHPHACRFYQVITANHQILNCDPEDAKAHYQLYVVYASQGRFDLALKHLQEVVALTGITSVLPPENPQHTKEREENDTRLVDLETSVNSAREQITTALNAQANRAQVAQSMYAAGFPLLALEVLEEDLTVVATNSAVQMLMGILLLEVGRSEEALTQFESLRPTLVKDQSPDWPTMTAHCNHAADDLLNAKLTLEESREPLIESMTTALLETAPLRFVGPLPSTEGELLWGEGELMAPIQHGQAVAVLTTSIEPQLESNELYQALLSIEMGQIKEALRLFDSIISRQPRSSARPMIEFYVELLDGMPVPSLDEAVAQQEPEIFTDEPLEDNKQTEESPPPDREPSESEPTESESGSRESSESEDAEAGAPPEPDLSTLPPADEALKSRPLVPDDGEAAIEDDSTE